MWDDVELVTLDQAKHHLRGTVAEEDDDLLLKLRQAHALVLDYIARASDADWTAEMLAWTDASHPPAVGAAILRQFGDLARFRGDDDDTGSADDGLDLSPRVKQLLRMYRTPVIA